jgi:hypothetical protein
MEAGRLQSAATRHIRTAIHAVIESDVKRNRKIGE